MFSIILEHVQQMCSMALVDSLFVAPQSEHRSEEEEITNSQAIFACVRWTLTKSSHVMFKMARQTSMDSISLLFIPKVVGPCGGRLSLSFSIIDVTHEGTEG